MAGSLAGHWHLAAMRTSGTAGPSLTTPEGGMHLLGHWAGHWRLTPLATSGRARRSRPTAEMANLPFGPPSLPAQDSSGCIPLSPRRFPRNEFDDQKNPSAIAPPPSSLPIPSWTRSFCPFLLPETKISREDDPASPAPSRPGFLPELRDASTFHRSPAMHSHKPVDSHLSANSKS